MVSWKTIHRGLSIVRFWTYHIYLRLNVNILIYIFKIAWKTWFVILENNLHQAQVYYSLKDDSVTKLYPSCSSFSRLSTILWLFNIKARNGWSDKSFTELLKLLHEILLEGNTLPTIHYEAKKILCPIGMEYQKIHVCLNDCILYRKKFEGLHKCPRRGVSRYKVKDDDGDEDDMKKESSCKSIVVSSNHTTIKTFVCQC